MKTTADGLRLHYEVEGDGPPVLLVHGYPLSSRLWAPTVERLKGEYRFIVPDLRGMGESEPSGPVPLRRFAADLAAVLKAAGEKRPAVVVGLSMGGYISFEFYRRYRKRVRALALVDTRAQPDAPDAAEHRRETAARVLHEGSAGVAQGMVGQLLAPSAPESLREEWRAIMAATPPRGVATALLAMADRPDARPLLRRLARPVLVVVGSEDAVTPPGDARRMAEAARDARLVVVPGAGHLTPVERPDEFAAALRDFLRSLPPEG
ncbi:MAG TPA: alpha/beta fold hydrolase [Longimicrobiaceae bacterium]|nr:alpha/beta fold hydrolase [Longimicrobiaceae bacterium]